MARRKPRVVRPNERYIDKTTGERYDSKFEYDLHRTVLQGWELHGKKIEYFVEHTYNPDFSKTIGDKTYHIEAKGRFWDSMEYSKYVWVKKILPPNEEIIFIFLRPSLPMPRAKSRADGTKRTHSEWAEEHGFRWFTSDTFPKELR